MPFLLKWAYTFSSVRVLISKINKINALRVKAVVLVQ